jgi:hypothetical protein
MVMRRKNANKNKSQQNADNPKHQKEKKNPGHNGITESIQYYGNNGKTGIYFH